MRQQDPLPRKPKQPQSPAVPFDPNNPSTWPKATPSNLAELQAKAGYKPLTGKATGSPVQPDTNMYNAGTMDVLRGAGNAFVKAGDFLIKTPLQSINRTASGQNLQTLVDPKSTATQRINAVGEDALNVLSFIPAFRSGGAVDDIVRYSDEGMAAAKQAYANFKNRKNTIPEWTPYIPYETPRRAVAAHNAMNNIEMDLAGEIRRAQVRPQTELFGTSGSTRYTDVVDRPEWNEQVQEGTMRFWHTTPKGEPLPKKLLSMAKAARIPGRRGSGANQLLSGGPYFSSSGQRSGSYFEGFGDSGDFLFPGSVIPDQMLDEWLAVPAIWKQNWERISTSDKAAIDAIRQMQINDYRNQMIGLDDLASRLPLANDPFRFANSKKTVREVLEEAATPEEAMEIINSSLRPIVYKPSVKPRDFGKGYIDDQINNIERLNFRHPIVRNPDGSYGRTAIVSPNTNLYLWGTGTSTARMPFSQNYFDELNKLSTQWIEDPNNMSRFVNANPYKRFAEMETKPVFQMHRNRFPGQNYIDLPVLRDDNGVIQSIGGLKALDIDSNDPRVFETLYQNIRDFIAREYPDDLNSSTIQSALNSIKNLHSQEARTSGYTRFQNEIFNALKKDTFGVTEELTPKEKFYEFLADNGYGVIPHSGGQVTGSSPHLALNVLKPEELPPTTFLSDKGENIRDLINQIARQKAIQIRAVNSKMTSAPYNEAMFKAALDRIRGGAARTGGQLIASSNLQRIGGY